MLPVPTVRERQVVEGRRNVSLLRGRRYEAPPAVLRCTPGGALYPFLGCVRWSTLGCAGRQASSPPFYRRGYLAPAPAQCWLNLTLRQRRVVGECAVGACEVGCIRAAGRLGPRLNVVGRGKHVRVGKR